MKTKYLLTVCFIILHSSFILSTHAQGTAFTYQGRLNDGANVANGSYDLSFALFNVVSGAGQVGNTLTNSTIGVSNGLFTVTLDFGNQFPGADRWLEIGVRTNGGTFTTLSPRQKLTPTPYAITAENVTPGAGLSGTYGSAITLSNSANQFTGSFVGNGASVTNVNAAMFGGLASSNFWQLGGNNVANGQFLGSLSTFQPLEFRMGGVRALRLELNGDGAPNVIGGSSRNTVTAGVRGAFIGGGGSTNYFGSGVSYTNKVSDDFGVVSGGANNTVSCFAGTIGGGLGNIVSGFTSDVIAVGANNVIGINPEYSAIVGGQSNTNNGNTSTIAGGQNNFISDFSSDSTIAGGSANTINQSGACAIGDGFNNVIQINSGTCTIAGGSANTASGQFSAIGGGRFNQSSADYGTVSGGEYNTNSGQFAFVAGGLQNQAAGDFSFAAGRRAKANHDGTFVWADSQNANFSSTGTNQFLIRASGGVGIGTASPQADLHVNGSTVLQGLVAPPASSATNILNLGSGATADGFRNGISFFETATATAMGFGYDGTGDSAHNALRIYHSSGKDLFTFQANGSLGVGTNSPQQALHVIGNILASGTVTGSSDRNVKENFTPVNPLEVLNKVTAMPISRWNYKTETEVTHLGPMAQDFYSAFAVGMDDKHISMVDADGALAAIQGLNQKLEEQRAENAELKRRLESLEKIIRNQKSN
jgi:trimeric autotransporter adhesin